MTYKLNHEIRKIICPVVLVFPDSTRREYGNGVAVVEDQFEKKYFIKTIDVADDTVELNLAEQEAPNMNWCGEEAISFF